MDYKLAKEIYGNAWCVDHITFIQLNKTLNYFQNGGQLKETEEKANAYGILSNNVFTPYRVERLERNGAEVPAGSIAQYNFDSVITKHGGMSHYGTKEIGGQFQKMEANDNIIGHLFYVESGGGSAAAIKYINEVASKEVRKKPLVTYFEDINGSAAYIISSNSDYIIANDKSALVGSLGTMIEMDGFKSGEKDANGQVHLRIYSDYSGEKNQEFEKAINEFNYKLIKDNILNPLALEAIEHVSNNRPQITAKQKRAAIFRAEDALGTLIDDIGTMQTAIDKINELANNTRISGDNNNNNINNKSMDLAKLKAEHPAVYAAAHAEGKQEGITQERDRVESWAVFNEIDPVKVKAGIESGKQLTAKASAEFTLQSIQGKKLEEVEKENTEDLNLETEAKTEADSKKEALDKFMGRAE